MKIKKKNKSVMEKFANDGLMHLNRRWELFQWEISM